jgi:hypothetical protein
MTQAQKIAKEKFKKAIEYRKKTGATLKEAFAFVYGRKVSPVKKKAAPKKKAASKKIAAIKIIEKGENKSTKAKATYQQVRTKKGTYKGLKKVGEMAKYKKAMYSMGNIDTKKLLDQFAKEGKLKKDVVTILKRKASRYDNDYKSMFEDILNNGLQSGVISELIYYSDTLKWYNKHKNEIKLLLRDSMMNYGTNNPSDLFGRNWDQDDPFVEDTANKNLLTWFSFEETAREIADNLGYEL